MDKKSPFTRLPWASPGAPAQGTRVTGGRPAQKAQAAPEPFRPQTPAAPRPAAPQTHRPTPPSRVAQSKVQGGLNPRNAPAAPATAPQRRNQPVPPGAAPNRAAQTARTRPEPEAQAHRHPSAKTSQGPIQRRAAATKNEVCRANGRPVLPAPAKPKPVSAAARQAGATETKRGPRWACAPGQERAVIQRMRAPSQAGVIQRRIPNKAAIGTLLTGVDSGNNFRKMQKAVRRMVQEGNRISQQVKNKINVELSTANLNPFATVMIVNTNFDFVVAGNEVASWRIVLNMLADLAPELTYTAPENATALPTDISDKLRLMTVYGKAVAYLNALANSTAHDADIEKVFGSSNVVAAKEKYGHAKTWLEKAYNEGRITTDYHGDDTEIGVGGYAMAGVKIHLARMFFVGPEPDAIVTLVHESCHLGNPSVLDHGYQGSPMFKEMAEPVKLCNAAHFEEPVRRILGNSMYPGETFTPASALLVQPTHYEKGKRDASETVRKAWTVGSRLLGWMRDVFKYNKTSPLHAVGSEASRLVPVGILPVSESNLFAWVNYWSSMTGMTFHKKTGIERSLTTLDLTVLEGVVRKLLAASQRVATASAADESGLPEELTKPYHLHLLVDHNISETLKVIGGIRASYVRDLEMVKKMAEHEGNEWNLVTFLSPTKLAK